MKKQFCLLCLLSISLTAQAQFEQGKFIINPAITGLDLSHTDTDDFDDTRLGINGLVGAFLVDNAALMVGLGAEWSKIADTYSASVGGRYYFQTTGVYAGGGLKLQYLDPEDLEASTNFQAYAEVGYAFFISQTVTLEPAVYYDLGLENEKHSKFGLKVGFGIYF